MILSGLDINKGGIYTFTSPHESYYFKKKILMFTIPKAVLDYHDDVENLKTFEDIVKDNNVIYALACNRTEVAKAYERVAVEMKERFYFFKLVGDDTEKCELMTIGFEYFNT